MSEPRHAHVWPILGIIFLGLLVMTVPMYYTSRSSFCNSCHIMKPYYEAWSKSTHAKESCEGCHNAPGVLGFLGGKMRLTKQIIVNFTSRPDSIEESTIANDTCYACHNLKRRVTPTGDLKLPPRHHLAKDKNLPCTQCHSGLVHATQPAGKNKPREAVCIKCHQQKGISTECRTCHRDK